jgi:hypothetical protein
MEMVMGESLEFASTNLLCFGRFGIGAAVAIAPWKCEVLQTSVEILLSGPESLRYVQYKMLPVGSRP